MDRAIRAPLGQQGQGTRQKVGELRWNHLARRHRKFAMVCFSVAPSMAVDHHVVGRVGEDDVCALLSHQRRERRLIPRIPAVNAVLSQLPKIAELRNDNSFLSGQLIGAVVLDRLAVQDDVEFGNLKARKAYVYLILKDEMLQLDSEDSVVPACVLSQTIVCDDICPHLGWRQTLEQNSRNALQTKEFGSFHSAVARDDGPCSVYKDWVRESEGSDAVRNFADCAFEWVRALPA